MDRRMRRTRTQLLQALISLLDTKPLNGITVTELTKIADVNRATFYAHYKDVYELFDELKTECCLMFRELIIRHAEEIQHDDTIGVTRELFEYFDANEQIFTLLTKNGDATLYGDIITTLQDALAETVLPIKCGLHSPNRRTVNRNDHLEMMLFVYQFDFIVGGLVSLLQRWFTNGRKESVDTMAALANNYIQRIGTEAFDRGRSLLEANRAKTGTQAA
ncbi:TetR/AcrR family transcriptional regulator [Bifidobacterium tissieri]|uniref:TetR/AcrR family transcriptional regulator n=1 Tax=Bifidobacterium tissieri TaxID=1630162 RepID=A0A5M9ZZW7_9BIFI|nr:TetR/AcrR family transcriptional regulator [Bifidobacterium tissieri]KAA8828829.1 TetR/AcrR family transcriptional regulator [Bifidobacterium tissieri]KAA8832969.1 TetR/AcrR family transcriptional regulator [Bifidobacterium tissieri]